MNPGADPVRDYLLRIGRTPLLTAAEEVSLGERMAAAARAARLIRQGDPTPGLRDIVAAGRSARRHLIEANMRLVVPIAKGPSPCRTSSSRSPARGHENGLAPRSALVMRLRFGMDGHDPHTPRQIAEKPGLTPQWVRRIEKESLTRLRGHGSARRAWRRAVSGGDAGLAYQRGAESARGR